VQSLLDLDDYAPADSPGMGQLKITMAQFFRVNGGSTQNRGVVPDIRFPSVGDPAEYGESALDNALPWTSIEPARYEPAGDLSRLVAVTESHFRMRMNDDEEFGWLLTDIGEYNTHADEKEVSLLESVGRQKMAESESKKAERKAKRSSTEPLLGEDSVIAGEPNLEVETERVDADSDEEEEEAGPDLLLREAARIVADQAALEADMELLQTQFTQLNNKKSDPGKIN
jgi:carboxyl-terminal processing protease